MPTRLTPLKLWTAIFALWALFLSGIFASFVGSPGVIQALRLGSLLRHKQARAAHVVQEMKQLRLDVVQLEHSKASQQREIRRVLGYLAADEILFDFSNSGESLEPLALAENSPE